MLIYSQKTLNFIANIKSIIKTILSQEVGLKVGRERFYDQAQRASYPIQLVIYDHKSPLGYFDPNFYELGFHECLMRGSLEQLRNVIRHEIAHYITFIEQGALIQPHGLEFKTFCQQMGWGDEVSRATLCLEEIFPLQNGESDIVRKVQKLMALSSSSNAHEAEQAIIKSQQLLLKHNLTAKDLKEDEEAAFLKRVLEQKKESAKMRAISKILSTFLVSTVFRKGKGMVCLEILGSRVNVEIAEYVADVLNRELDLLWKETKLKGAVAKNSFFLGVAKGYCQKIEALKKTYDASIRQGVMVLEKKLTDAKALVYPRLSLRQTRANYCPESATLGEKAGRGLNIHPGLKKTSFSFEFLIEKK